MSLQLDHTPEKTAPNPWSLRLGRPFGIETRVHATFALLVVFVAWSAWTEGIAQGHSAPWAAVLVSVGFLVGVFACVLAHELGHALMARRFGIGTDSITLSPIGGVAQLLGLPKSPKQELLIAIAGPAVNFVIAGVLFGALHLLAPLASFPAAVFAMQLSTLLVYGNLVMGVFNLIPAFPMDGGRVLRAALELRMGRVRATDVAATVGKVFAVLFFLWGLTSNWLLSLIAVFIWMAGERERRMVWLAAQWQAMQDDVRKRGGRVGWWPGSFVAAPSPVDVEAFEHARRAQRSQPGGAASSGPFIYVPPRTSGERRLPEVVLIDPTIPSRDR